METKKKSPGGNFRWQIWFGIALIAFSGVIYAFQILIFRKPDETFFLMMQDFAFVPISVLLVTMIVEGVLNYREKQALHTKLYMVIGIFFTEMGMQLLRIVSELDAHIDAFRKVLSENLEFDKAGCERIMNYVNGHDFRIRTERTDLPALKEFLMERRDSVMRLLENPNLLEHETFTNLLWAVSHLTEELAYRPDLNLISRADHRHIDADIARAYSLLMAEWVAYVRHLRIHYPFIFSLVVRINPFDPNATAEVKE